MHEQTEIGPFQEKYAVTNNSSNWEVGTEGALEKSDRLNTVSTRGEEVKNGD